MYNVIVNHFSNFYELCVLIGQWFSRLWTWKMSQEAEIQIAELTMLCVAAPACCRPRVNHVVKHQKPTCSRTEQHICIKTWNSPDEVGCTEAAVTVISVWREFQEHKTLWCYVGQRRVVGASQRGKQRSRWVVTIINVQNVTVVSRAKRLDWYCYTLRINKCKQWHRYFHHV